MCAIISWAGNLPPGLLKNLILASEDFGKDSTGVSYLNSRGKANLMFKHAVSPTRFVKIHDEKLKLAQKSTRGIAHARLASVGLPINSFNAHPFIYESRVFAHNGFIRNWKSYKAELLNQTSIQNNSHSKKYVENITTDSMVLGPALALNDFKRVFGRIGLVWLKGASAYCLKSNQNLTSAKLNWNFIGSSTRHTATIAVTHWKTLIKALKNTEKMEYSVKEFPLSHGTIYELLPEKIVQVRDASTNNESENTLDDLGLTEYFTPDLQDDLDFTDDFQDV